MFRGIVPKLILWHHFLDDIVEPERAYQESCAWIFVDLVQHVWHVIEVKNIGLKYHGDTIEERIRSSFAPDPKDFARIKRKARKYKLTKIGCVHTHVIRGNDETEVRYQSRPSEADIKYAKRFNDIVRAVIVVQYPDCKERGVIRDIVWFDQYGNILGKD